MRSTLLNVTLTLALAVAVTAGCSTMNRDGVTGVAAPDNRKLVQDSFDRWRAGTGGPFELLADDARWTIVGSSPASRTYDGKEQFMAEVIRPFNARMDRPLKPTVRRIYSDGAAVVVLFDAESQCVDGLPYRNTYAWFIEMKDGRAVDVTAFFDTRTFDEMWSRVTPR